MKELLETNPIAESILGMEGRMISNSKSDYAHNNPTHVIMFNADLVANNEKIWWGDLDLTLDEEKLVKLAATLDTTLFLYHEGEFGRRLNPEPAYSVSTQINSIDDCDRFERNDNGSFVIKEEVPPSDDLLKQEGAERAAQFDEADYPESVELPDIDSLLIKCEDDPLVQFAYKLEKIIPRVDADSRINLTCLWMSDEYYSLLKMKCIEWFIADSYSDWERDDAEYQASKDLDWYFLGVGPCSFGQYSSPSWAKPNHAYFKTGEFYKANP